MTSPAAAAVPAAASSDRRPASAAGERRRPPRPPRDRGPATGPSPKPSSMTAHAAAAAGTSRRSGGGCSVGGVRIRPSPARGAAGTAAHRCPSISRSCSTRAKRPLRLRHSTMCWAVTGPTPGSVSSCATLAVLRSIFAAGPARLRPRSRADPAPPARRRAARGRLTGRVGRGRNADRDLLAVDDPAREVEPGQIDARPRATGGRRAHRPPAPRPAPRTTPGPRDPPGHADHQLLRRPRRPPWPWGLRRSPPRPTRSLRRWAPRRRPTAGRPRTGSACGRDVHTPTAATTAATTATSTNATAPGRPGSRRTPCRAPARRPAGATGAATRRRHAAARWAALDAAFAPSASPTAGAVHASSQVQTACAGRGESAAATATALRPTPARSAGSAPRRAGRRGRERFEAQLDAKSAVDAPRQAIANLWTTADDVDNSATADRPSVRTAAAAAPVPRPSSGTTTTPTSPVPTCAPITAPTSDTSSRATSRRSRSRAATSSARAAAPRWCTARSTGPSPAACTASSTSRCAARAVVRTFSSGRMRPCATCSSGFTASAVPTSAAAAPIRPPRRSRSRVSSGEEHAAARGDVRRRGRDLVDCPRRRRRRRPRRAPRSPGPCTAARESTTRTRSDPTSSAANRAASQVPDSSRDRCTETTADAPGVERGAVAGRERGGRGPGGLDVEAPVGQRRAELARVDVDALAPHPGAQPHLERHHADARAAPRRPSGREEVESVTTATGTTSSLSAPTGSEPRSSTRRTPRPTSACAGPAPVHAVRVAAPAQHVLRRRAP